MTSRARTESINFDSRILIRRSESEIKKIILIREVYQNRFWFLIHLGESFYFWFWFIFHSIQFDSFWFLFIMICVPIWFYSFWFGLILIRRESWLTCESKIKGRWIVIHSFPIYWLIRFRIKSESKWIANRALVKSLSWKRNTTFLKYSI